MSRSYSSSSMQQYSSGNRKSGGIGGSFRKSYGGMASASASSSFSSLGYSGGGGMGYSGGGGMGYSGGGGIGFSQGQGSFAGLLGSSSSSMLMSGGGGGGGGGMVTNEKETMINLNTRLSSYLQKVKDLESGNTQLELQVKEFQVGKAISGIDYVAYDAVIRPLRDQILSIHLGNARLALDLDNASLAAKDFNNKFENEFNTRQSVEADIGDLRYLKEEYIRNYKDLESEIAAAQDELVYLKKNHEEELVILRQQVTGTVSVDVASGPAPDLTKALAQIREEYEIICSKNQAETEVWYKQQVETQTVQTVQVNEAAETAKLQITELRRQFQTLQAEYDSLFSGNCSLEGSIQDINNSYSQKLHGLQVTISQMEMDVINIRNEVSQKVKDYEMLLNIKMQLEKEIATYRLLIEGTSGSAFFTTSGTEETSGTVTTTTTKIETRTMTDSSQRI